MSQVQAVFFHFIDGLSHFVVIDMAFHIDKEYIFPGPPLRRPRFDLREIDLRILEWIKDIVKCTWLVFEREHDRCLIRSRFRR